MAYFSTGAGGPVFRRRPQPCCGVHARFDLDPSALEGSFSAWGTTNVDFNSHMRAALAAVSDADALLMRIGHDELSVTTTADRAVERRVPIPQRWLKGLAEVQLACSTMSLRYELTALGLRRFLQALPSPPGGLAWATPTGGGVRLSSRPDHAAVCLAAPERLRPFVRLLRFARGLRVYGPAPQSHRARGPEPSAWEMLLEDGRLTLTLSPEPFRGFSGEGGILLDLASAPDELVDKIAGLLEGDPLIDPVEVARRTCAPVAEVQRALGVLAAAGRVGYDLAERSFFHRELPFDRSILEAMHPRTSGARAIVEAGDVELEGGGLIAVVRSGEVEYRVHFADGSASCTCPWFVKHRGTRGPCKHVLAAELARSRASSH